MRPVLTRLGKMFAPSDPAEAARKAEADRGWMSRITRLGPMFTSPAVAVEEPDEESTGTEEEKALAKAEERELVKRVKALAARQGRDELRTVWEEEYTRSDGGRLAVKRELAKAGFGKPEA